MPNLKLSVRLSDMKTALQLAQEGLKGAGFFPGVEAIAGIPLKLIEYCENVADNKHEMDQLASTLESLQGVVIEPIKAAHKGSHQYVPELERRVRRLNEILVEVESELAPIANLGRLSSFRKREEISAALKAANESINRAISHFQLGGQITVETKVWEQSAERLLSKLRPAPARFDSSEKQPCLPNTRSTLLSTLRDHIHSSPRTFVCLYGSPGTGKSAVAKSIATELHQHRLLAASYFFDKRGGDAGNISLATFVSTLAYQLARFSFDFHAALSRQLERDPLLADATADVQLRELLLEPLREVFANRPPKRRWIIVLDALDECGDADHQRRLMLLLRSCVALGPHVVFFLTCRPEATITQVMQGWRLSPRSVVESMDSQDQADTTDDIRTLMESRLLEMKAAEGWAFIPSPEQIGRLVELCDGLFEVAAIRLRQLDGYFRCSPLRKAFADVLRLAENSASSPSPLYSVYTGLLATAYTFPDDSWRRAQMLSLYHMLVGTLTVLRQPLAIGALAALVGVEEDEARKALEPLSSVVAVPGMGEPVHFYHASFLEFLVLRPTSGQSYSIVDPDYSINSFHSHVVLASRTLKLMYLSLRRNILDLPNTCIPNNAISGLSQALVDHVPPQLHYACLYWAEHLQSDGMSTYGDLLGRWCDEKIMLYLEVLSLLGEMKRAVPLFEAAEKCVRKVADCAPSATLLSNAQRMVQMFYPAITSTAGALYTSAIPFMPSCRFREQYSGLGDKGPSLVRGRMPAWSPELWTTALRCHAICVAMSPDGQQVASGCENGVIYLLSTITGEIEHVLKGHTQDVHSTAFSPDSQHLASGSSDKSVRIWSTATGETKHLLEGHAGSVRSTAFSPDGQHLASGASDEPLRIWSTATGEIEHLLQGNTHAVTSTAFSADGQHLVSGSIDESLRTWSTATGEIEHLLQGPHTHVVTSTALSPDGRRLASRSSDESLRIWSTATGEIEHPLQKFVHVVTSTAFSPDGRHVASGLIDKSVQTWSFATGEQGRAMHGHRDYVTSLAFSPDGTRLASGLENGSVHVWSLATGEQERVLEGHGDYVTSLAFSPDGTRIVSGSLDSSVRLWSITAEEQQRVVQGHLSRVTSVDFSPAGARFVSGSKDGSVCIWSTITGEQERVLVGCTEEVASLAFSSDGRGVKCTNYHGGVFFWEVETGLMLDHNHPIAQLEFPLRAPIHPPCLTLYDGWLPVDDNPIWIPRYLQGVCWPAHGMVVMNPEDTPGGLALIKLPSDRESNQA